MFRICKKHLWWCGTTHFAMSFNYFIIRHCVGRLCSAVPGDARSWKPISRHIVNSHFHAMIDQFEKCRTISAPSFRRQSRAPCSRLGNGICTISQTTGACVCGANQFIGITEPNWQIRNEDELDHDYQPRFNSFQWLVDAYRFLSCVKALLVHRHMIFIYTFNYQRIRGDDMKSIGTQSAPPMCAFVCSVNDDAGF